MRLIDADELKDSLCFPCDRSQTGYTVEECRKNGCGMMSVIDNQPTIEPEVRQPTVSTDPERKHGHWIMMDADRAKCSVCGWWQKSNGKDKTGKGLIFSACYHYCTACGATMDGGAENDER